MMWERFSDWLSRVSTGRVALVALVVFLLFTALVLPGQSTRAEVETGVVGPPDTTFFYSTEDLYQMAKAYGPQGRQAYVRARFTFDLVWPLVYALFLCTATSYVNGRTFSEESWLQRTNLVPMVGTILDYLENLSTSLVMLRYPNRTPVIDLLAPLFSAAKWAFLGASFVLLIAGIVVAIWRWRETSGNMA